MSLGGFPELSGVSDPTRLRSPWGSGCAPHILGGVGGSIGAWSHILTP